MSEPILVGTNNPKAIPTLPYPSTPSLSIANPKVSNTCLVQEHTHPPLEIWVLALDLKWQAAKI